MAPERTGDLTPFGAIANRLLCSLSEAEEPQPKPERKPPYPHCRHALICAEKGYCTNDPNCGD